MAFDGWFLLACKLRGHQQVAEQKEQVRRKIVRFVQSGGPRRPTPIERVANLTPRDFKQNYLRPGKPVLIEGAARNWNCCRRWTLEFLRDRCGDEIVKITQRRGVTTEAPIGDKEYSHEMPFREYVDQLLNGGKPYLRFSSLLEAFPELLEDLDLGYLKQMRSSSGAWVQAFIGAKASRTPFHAAMSEGLFINVLGVKRWVLVPSHYNAIMNPDTRPSEIVHTGVDALAPDLDAYPGFDCIDKYEVIQQPGDILYFPAWMWHYVENLEHTIGLRYGFASVRGAWVGSPGLTLVRALVAKPSLFAQAYTTYVRRNTRSREDQLLAPAVIDD